MRALVHLAFLLAVAAQLVAFGGDRAVLRPDVDDDDGANRPDASAHAEVDDDSDDDGDDDGNDDAVAGRDEAPDEADDIPSIGSSTLAEVDAGRHKHPTGGCSSNMARAGTFCIDRYEAPNRRGAHPLVMQSANDAGAWCAAHHKRLCTEDEWISACEGDEHRAYPYGSEHVDGRCNDDKSWRQVDEAILARWPAPEAKAHTKDLYQAAPSGSKRKCVSGYGARDMTGNVEEWVVRTREHDNAWPYILIGCYWSGCYGGGKPTCHSTNNAHGPEFRFYETGFRCCRDVRAVTARGH